MQEVKNVRRERFGFLRLEKDRNAMLSYDAGRENRIMHAVQSSEGIKRPGSRLLSRWRSEGNFQRVDNQQRDKDAERRNLWRGEIATSTLSFAESVGVWWRSGRQRVGGPGRPCLRKHYAFLHSRQNARAYHPRHPEFIIRDSARRALFSRAPFLDYYFPKLWINRYVSIDFYRLTGRFGVRRRNMIARMV